MCDEGCINLANGIIVQAVKDYRYSLMALQIEGISSRQKIECDKLKNQCEKFFKSEWFQMLTTIDGELIMCETKRRVMKKKKKLKKYRGRR